MVRPKLLITKKRYLDSRGHFRYFNILIDSPYIFNLDNGWEVSKRTGEPYPYLNVKTEKELLWVILNHFGEGEYRIFSYLKHRKGTYIFFEGEVNSQGWIFNEKVTEEDRDLTKDILDLNRLNEEYDNSQDDEEKMELKARMSDQEDWIRMQKDFAKGEQKHIRYGFQPFLEPSGRRGQFHAWDEDNNLYDGPNTSDQDAELDAQMQKTNLTKTKKPFEQLSIDDLNGFT